MEIAAIIVVVVVIAGAFFGVTGFKTRCPNCGVFKLHAKDRARNAEMVNAYNDAVSVGFPPSQYSKPAYVNDWLRCGKCGALYQRHTANEWMNVSRDLGEEDALLEYRKLQEEIAAGRQRRAEARRTA